MMLTDEVVFHPFCHTAQHTDDKAGHAVLHTLALSPLAKGIQFFQPMIDLVLCILAYRTGIQEDRIRLFHIVTCLIPRHLHDRSNHFGVGYIHLTAIGLNIEFFHPFLIICCKVTN